MPREETAKGSRISGLPDVMITAAALGTLMLVSCGAHGDWNRPSRPLAPRGAISGPPVEKPSMASTHPEFYVTGPEIKAKMLELINAATDYILIDSFLVMSDPTSREVLEALAQKRRAGVRIHVLSDSSSLYAKPGEAGFGFLQNAGIPCTEYNPMRPYKLVVAPVMLPRDHRKFWIVDGKVLFLGGANIFASSLKPPTGGGNRDFMVALESRDAIEQMVKSFVGSWNAHSEPPLDKRDFPVQSGHPAETRIWLHDQNKDLGQEGVITSLFDSLFAAAREEVWLIQPYTFVNRGLLERIRQMSSRGVEVNIMLSGEVLAPRFHYASFYGIKDLLEAGARVWIFQPGQGALHSKAIVVDRRWASVGSANLNWRSHQLSCEVNLLFGDRRSVGKVIGTLEDLRSNCRPAGLAESRRYRSPRYYLTWLWMQWTG